MTFGSLLPLIALVGVPIIIILYMMKPKGKRKVIPSLLLWKNRERYDTSVTFARKIIRNILLFLEILALLFLIFAAMSPKLKLGGASKEDTLIVIDTSGSMQFLSEPEEGGSGRTRFEEAIKDASDYIELSSGNISIMSAGEKIELLANSITDKQKLRRAINNINVTDGTGDINKAESIFRSLQLDKIIIYTDSEGAGKLESLVESSGGSLPLEVRVYGHEASNIGISQVSMKKNSEGLYDIAIGYQKTGQVEADFDISLYDQDGSLLEVRTINTQETSGNTVLMMGKDVKGSYVRAELGGIHFTDDNLVDGLDRDNVAYSVVRSNDQKTAYLVGVGNTYLEKAYLAVSGENVIKVASDSEISQAGSSEKDSIALYDRADLVTGNYSRFVQAYRPDDAELIDGAMVTVKTGQLIKDMSDYEFGAGKLSVLDCPEWAQPLMVVKDNENEKTVAYYGENEGVRQIVLGFDIRDSEYPLMAEFPIFIADGISYLTDESLVRDEYIQAGSMVSLSPSVSKDAKLEENVGNKKEEIPIGDFIDHAGLYSLTYKIKSSQSDKNDKEVVEYFVARYPISEGDGSGSISSMTYAVQAESGVRMSSLRRIALIIALILLILDWGIYLFRYSLKSKDSKDKNIFAKLRELSKSFTSRGWAENAISILLILLVLLAVIGFELPAIKRKTATIFIIDMSDSAISSLASQEAYVKEKIDQLPDGEMVGIVTFGQNAETEQFLAEEVVFSTVYTEPDGSQTNIQGAVEYAAALLPDDRAGRIVVLSDGRETTGDINSCKDTINQSDIEICGLLLDIGLMDDIYVENVDMPEKLSTGDAYVIKVTIYSSRETGATLSIWDGSQLEEEKKVKLNKGDNTFLIDGVAGDKAVEEKKITIEAEGDTIENNNTALVAALVDAPQSVLLISGIDEDSSGFEGLLSQLNVSATVVSALNAPDTLLELLQYKTIIIDNAYITDLPEG
nr:BatA and WFA domain-containing protein [Eubacterium sp.]